MDETNVISRGTLVYNRVSFMENSAVNLTVLVRKGRQNKKISKIDRDWMGSSPNRGGRIRYGPFKARSMKLKTAAPPQIPIMVFNWLADRCEVEFL